MQEQLITFLYSALGGGIAAIVFKVIEKYWIGFKLNENIEAKKKLKHYAKVLWFDFHELSLRLKHIQHKIKSQEAHELHSLKYSLDQKSIEWFTKQGYYAASTAYLIASSSSWIRILQREIVFLEFSKKSITADFFEKIEAYKRIVSGKGSIIWYHYFNGIGEKLIDEKNKCPITFATFIELLANNPQFKDFFDQLFRFLDALTDIHKPQNLVLLKDVTNHLEELKQFLSENANIPQKEA